MGFVGILKTSAWLVMQAVQLQSNLKIGQNDEVKAPGNRDFFGPVEM